MYRMGVFFGLLKFQIFFGVLEIPVFFFFGGGGGGASLRMKKKMRVSPPPSPPWVYRLLGALPVEAESGLHKKQLILLRISKLDTI